MPRLIRQFNLNSPSSIPQHLSCLSPWLWLWLLSWPVRYGWGGSSHHLHELGLLSRPFTAVASPISLLPGHEKYQKRRATTTTLDLNAPSIQGKYQSRYGCHVRYWKPRFPRELKYTGQILFWTIMVKRESFNMPVFVTPANVPFALIRIRSNVISA